MLFLEQEFKHTGSEKKIHKRHTIIFSEKDKIFFCTESSPSVQEPTCTFNSQGSIMRNNNVASERNVNISNALYAKILQFFAENVSEKI